jgi:hypothetical protein
MSDTRLANDVMLSLVGNDFQYMVANTDYDKFTIVGGEKPPKEAFEAKLKELIDAQPLKELREERNTRLAEVDWVFSGDYRVDIEMYQEWLLYRKALRDLPSTTEDPVNPIWPKKPATANGKTVDYYERDTQSTKIILLQNVVNSLMKRIENLENP